MTVVIQEEIAGCGIASVANIVGVTYAEAKQVAAKLGIFADDPALHSSTTYVRRLLAEYGISASPDEAPFKSWEELPPLALLSIKYYIEDGSPFWHWVVFKRDGSGAVVLDSAAYLDENERTDFDAMQPEWYVEIAEL